MNLVNVPLHSLANERKTMTFRSTLLVTSTLTCLSISNPGHAQEKSRSAVRAETVAAQQAGQIADNESGHTPAQWYPQRYPATPAPTGKSRAQLEQEVRAALMSDGSMDKATEDPQFPTAYRYGNE